MGALVGYERLLHKRKMKLFQKSNVVSAVCLGIFALSFLVNRLTRLGLFDVGAMLFWTSLAWVVVKRPRGFGLPVAILAFCSVVLQFHYTRSSLAEHVAGTDIQVSPKLWVRFWISVLPLILGGGFAAVSFWVSGRGITNPTKVNVGDVPANPPTEP